ncbi:DEAD/DEAH box helicase [Leekyejoonella antrihumi]|uniref:DEAD/DEAH box helicase n=1 Tax=Leekyejoonella antrihumi TaxID=1660198 RepID=A0A563DWF7_9MICO|nr:DEAD/DEAH box helicase [Leekyejoonella antrihumi]TWP34301.1 DEAD/DEAH box helicase [Leekyejoonella antrihumi]
MVDHARSPAASATEPISDPAALLALLAETRDDGGLLHVEDLPERRAVPADWPDWVNPQVRAAITGDDLTQLWSHQRQAADLAHAGKHLMLSTGTASGKSLGYLIPTLSAIADGSSAPTGRGATGIYLAPTKALAADQEARIRRWAIPGVRAAALDGDTPPEERRWIRDHVQLVLTNPDMLHYTLLPAHERWASFLRALRYVVIDESHAYKGVFGSHVALILRRLRRVAARYRSAPTFILTSATTAHPAEHAQDLIGLPVQAITEDGSPRAARTFGLWEPPVPPDGSDTSRRSAVAESADLMTTLMIRGVQTLTFARSRPGVEVVAEMVRHAVQGVSPPVRVAAYRGGYLPEERRELEADLREGRLRGLAATSALELGIDISGLDAVILAGWPGTLASLWQQAGRAGRSGKRSLVILVAADDPLDTYLVHHPETIFGRAVEATTVNPANPYVLAPHLASAAYELPLTRDDVAYFGDGMEPLLDSLVQRGVLRRRPRGWFWARDDRPADHFSLRGSGDQDIRIVESRTGRVLGTVDADRSHSAVHTGAVYVHQGRTHVVTELNLEDGSAHVVVGDPGWSTVARSVSAFDILGAREHQSWGPVTVSYGDLRVRTQVTSFLRLSRSGEVIGEHPLDLPERELLTKGVWWTAPEEVLLDAGLDPGDLPGSLHAAEHASIGMLPLVAQSDRWDIGGVSTALHPDTGMPTVVVYDGHPGGAGFAQRGYAEARRWLSATHQAIVACGCRRGCPSCVQSPKCGNGNNPLDKAGAITTLATILRNAS